MLKFTLLLIFGIIFIIAGIFKWPIPPIKSWVRNTKHGEILNTITMIILRFILSGRRVIIVFLVIYQAVYFIICGISMVLTLVIEKN